MFDWSTASSADIESEIASLTKDLARLNGLTASLEAEIKQVGRSPKMEADFLHWWKESKRVAAKRKALREILAGR